MAKKTKKIFITTEKNFNLFKNFEIKAEEYDIEIAKIKEEKKDIILAKVSETEVEIVEYYFIENAQINKEEDKIIFNFDNSTKIYNLSEDSKLKKILNEYFSYYHSYLEKGIKIYEEIDMEFSQNKNDYDNNNFYLEIPEFRKIFNDSKIPIKILSRHFLVLGETGSGKTYSILFPIIRALKKRSGEFSALVIDPKLNELKKAFEQNNSNLENIIILENECKKGKRIDIFEGFRDESFDNKIDYLLSISPRFQSQKKITDDRFWANASETFIKDLLRIDNMLRKRNSNIFDFLKDAYKNREISIDLNINYENDDVIINYDTSYLEIKYPNSYFKKLKTLVNSLLNQHILNFDNEANKLNELQNYLKDNNLPEISFFGRAAIDTFTSIVSVATPFFEDWTNDIISKVLWSDPFKKCESNLSIENIIKDRKILIFSIPPTNVSEDHYRLGKIIKNKFFKFTYVTYEYRKEKNIPLFYIADEFHRFITGDEETGEHNFLDRCRAYNVSCIIATQSVSSLQAGIEENSVANRDFAASVNIILNNCGTKIFFRTTDTHTNSFLREIVPPNPDVSMNEYGHIIDIFPVSVLSTGEGYFLPPDRKWGRYKIEV